MSIITAAKAAYVKVLHENPVRLISGGLAVVTLGAALLQTQLAVLQSADVHTWQAALPIFAGEVIRKYVFAPSTVTDILQAQAAALRGTSLPQLADKFTISGQPDQETKPVITTVLDPPAAPPGS